MKLPRFLIVTLCLVFLARIPSFFEPFYYGDELIYLTLGNGIRNGLVLYRDIHDNKTPLIYFLGALAGNVFWFRVILCIFCIASTILFWKLTKILFPKKNSLQKVSTIVFAVLSTLPIFEGQIANAEIFMILPTIAAFVLITKNGKSYMNYFLAGVMLSISTLFKVPAIFELGALFFYATLTTKFNLLSLKKLFLKIFFLVSGVFTLIGATFVWYAVRGGLNEYLNAAFLQNLGYVASTRTGSVQNSVPILVKLTPILLRGGVVAVGFVLLYLFRKKLGKPFLIACAWLLTSLFAVTLSERPYPHYLIQSLPAISLLLGMLLPFEVKEQALTIIPLSLAFFVPVYFKFWYYSPVPYITNFANLIITQDKNTYFNSYASNASINYEIAKEVKRTVNRDDRVFVWGDAPPIYALTRTLPPIKYVANYHINDYSSIEETVTQLLKTNPKLIIVMPNEKVPNELFFLLKNNYFYLNDVQGAKFWYNMGT